VEQTQRGVQAPMLQPFDLKESFNLTLEFGTYRCQEPATQEEPMTTFPGSPRLLKGAIVGLDPFNPLASVIVFQYNPDTLTRTLTAQTVGGNADRGEALRLKGPPEEKISLEVEIDATDHLERARPSATSLGVHPILASLEMLLYPKSDLVIANELLANTLGMIEVIPPEAPLTLLVWGLKRVVPVRLTQFTITEEAFDPSLNPIRAKVRLDLRVLNYNDLGLLSVGGALFMAHQVVKENMASLAGRPRVVRGVSQVAGEVAQLPGAVAQAAGGLPGLP
jgi:Contractile injection system tube protein